MDNGDRGQPHGHSCDQGTVGSPGQDLTRSFYTDHIAAMNGGEAIIKDVATDETGTKSRVEYEHVTQIISPSSLFSVHHCTHTTH